jgi:[ribosomal protein S18]-alanine N-acetyltransferase
MDDPFHLRAVTIDDLGAILEIENASFADPWSRSDFRGWLDHLFVAIETTGAVVAYALGRAVDDEGEIASVAVLPSHRSRGLADRLIGHLLHRMRDLGVRTVYLEVRESNSAAIALYRKHGFQTSSTRRKYYRNPPEDALVMSQRILP